MARLPVDRDVLRGATMLGVVVLVIAAGLSGALVGLLSGADTHTVRAVFADGQQLKQGSEVRIQGVPAGEVRDVELNPGGRDATVTMDVEDEAGPLYADAGAVLRFKSVLGGTFYVDLERGSRARGPLSGTIPVARTARQTEVDDVTAAVQGRARQGLQTLPRETAEALADADAPGRLLDTVARVAPDVRRGVGALRGQQLDRDLRGLVRGVASTVRSLDAPDDGLRRTVAGAAATLATTAARAGELRATLQRAPGTAREVQSTLTRLGATLDLADPLLARLEGPAGQVAPTFRELRPAVVEADRLVDRAVPLLRALRPAASSLAGTARRGLPLVKDLTPSVERLDRTILPYLNEVDPQTKRSTAVMIGGTFTGLASGAGGQMDANGHFIRFPATVGSSPLNSLPCQIYLMNPDAAQVAACNSLQEALATFMGYQPLGPTPGTEPASARRARKP
ncbi:MlaD family protein [Conexibacter sp. SYSU D00693]|uniref:MlaD family protein n=1 Tax=Conexibacter sp. SYSU D00693 TaxID=2812560 RepID=UPI00196B15E6|nr:MlaD family protein [Conexibacter sp. SYSU D00693]